MEIRSLKCNSVLAALFAAATVIGLSLAQPAHAASDYLLELDGVKGESAAKQEELDAKLSEMTQALELFFDQYENLEALRAEVTAMQDEVTELRKAGDDKRREYIVQFQEAQLEFAQKVAPFLDEEVVAAVSLNFSKIEMKYNEQERSAASSSGIDELASALAELAPVIENLRKTKPVPVTATQNSQSL
jgi:hypothetical protein